MTMALGYSFAVTDGPTSLTYRISGAVNRLDGRYPFNFVRDRSVPTSDITDELAAFQTLAEGFVAFTGAYLTDLAPTYGSDGGQILGSWAYCSNIYAWVLELQLALPSGEIVPVLIREADYNLWPTVQEVHDRIEGMIGTFPASAPGVTLPWVPANETDVGGAQSSTDQMVLALMNHFDTVPAGYSTIISPDALITELGYRSLYERTLPEALDFDDYL